MYMINTKVVRGYMEYRTANWETVEVTKTKREAMKFVKTFVETHPNNDVVVINEKTLEVVK